MKEFSVDLGALPSSQIVPHQPAGTSGTSPSHPGWTCLPWQGQVLPPADECWPQAGPGRQGEDSKPWT